mgnify:CR=1 FL=1
MKFSYLQVGRHMMNKASTENITDDDFFNKLCRHGESLTLIGQPFHPRRLTEEQKAFMNEYVETYMQNAA